MTPPRLDRAALPALLAARGIPDHWYAIDHSLPGRLVLLREAEGPEIVYRVFFCDGPGAGVRHAPRDFRDEESACAALLRSLEAMRDRAPGDAPPGDPGPG